MQQFYKTCQSCTAQFINKTGEQLEKVSNMVGYVIRFISLFFENEDSEIKCKAERVISNYNRKIKINVAFGFILKNRSTDELKFFHPSNNTMLFLTPKLLENASDYEQFRTDIEKEDAFQYARTNRPSTNWKVARIICVRFDVYKM